MRFITGGIMHETHTFSSEPTTMDDFEVRRGDEVLVYAGTNHSVGGVIDGCRERGIDLALTLQTKTVTAGPTDRATFEALVDEMVERIRAALPADGIVLTLHGAMVAEGYPDAEGEIARRVGAVVGPEMPIAMTLDFHANITQVMVENVSFLVGYDTYPHIDIAERAKEAVGLLAEVVSGRFKPTTAIVKPPLMPVPQAQHTSTGPFKALMDRAHELEDSGAARTITVAGGFAYADMPDAGVSIVVTTDDDPEGARRIAQELAEMAWSLREEMIVANVPVDEAVRQAIAAPKGQGPVMLVDVGDNIGGGTPGDGTELLRELLKQGAQDAVVVMADAEAVETAFATGVGGCAHLTVGGKVDRMHGDPVTFEGYVRLLSDGNWVHEGPENAGLPTSGGRTAVVQSGGVTVVLTSRKVAPGDQQQLKSVGIDPLRQHIIVVKAAVRWRGGYEPIMSRAILVDTPGLGSVALERFDFRHVRRPIFPLDRDVTWS